MKRTLYLSLIAICLLFIMSCNSCHFSKGFDKDLNTTLYVTYNGFSVKKSFLTDDKNIPLKNNKVHADIPFQIIINGIENYQLENERTFPGCEISVADDKGKDVGSLPDLFANQVNGMPPDSAANIAATYSLPAQLGLEKTYHVKARIFDKKNPKNEINATADVILEP